MLDVTNITATGEILMPLPSPSPARFPLASALCHVFDALEALEAGARRSHPNYRPLDTFQREGLVQANIAWLEEVYQIDTARGGAGIPSYER